MRSRATDLEPIGVIDIGSNSVRLVVYEGPVRAATPLFNEKVLCGLGRTVATTGRLGDEATDRALQALTRFKAIARVLRVKNMRAIATAAVRDAKDGPTFISRGEKACGVKIEILSGAEEARLAALGIRMGFVDADGTAGDLGGGSLELIDLQGEKLSHAATLPLGGLRLIDVVQHRIDDAIDLVDRQIASLEWIKSGKGRPFYAVGGTWRALAKLHMEQTSYPLRVMHGYALPLKSAMTFCEEVRRAKKVSSIPSIEEVAKARREVLPYGALVMERLLKKLQPSDVIFSVFGIREGLLYNLMSPYERKKDPLLSFADDFARRRSRSVEHAHELCDWTDKLFESVDPEETPQEQRLRHAACLFSDIGWRAHPDYRGEQSLDKIAHAALSGIDHPGRIFIGMAVYFRHAGPDSNDHTAFPEKLLAAINRRTQKRARILGAALRTAHMLSIGMPGVIVETSLKLEGQRLVLRLPKAHAGLDGERLRRRLAALGDLVDKPVHVHIADR
jgi:exopolyphosphatase / guanosine-5'-triphosphate,3'-diphosphate pyrophosphatase